MRIPASLLAASLVAASTGTYAADTTPAGETAKAGGDLLEVVVTVEALSGDVHSGLWGNMAPDPSVALMQVIAHRTHVLRGRRQ